MIATHLRRLAVALLVVVAPPALGQARVVSVPDEPSLLNLTASWARASTLGDLRELRKPADFVELRVWRGYGQSETQAIVLRRRDRRWSAFLARVIRCETQIPAMVADTASAATTRRYVAQARNNCGVPLANVTAGARIITTDTLHVIELAVTESEVETAWRDALSAGLAQLPPRVKRDHTVDEGIMYVIELRRGDEYRAAEIEHLERPEAEADTQVKNVYAAVRRLLPGAGASHGPF